MNKTLVAYFSCTGDTKLVAEKINNVVQGTLYEIAPEVPYTAADLNWEDNNSRSSKEMADKSSRPTIKKDLSNIDEYDTIYLGFPIWWYVAPTIINTFLESYDFTNKKIVVFCTSGGSSLNKPYENLKEKYPYNFIAWSKLSTGISEEEIKSFVTNI